MKRRGCLKWSKYDCILIAAVIAAALLIWGYSLLTREPGAYVVVTVEGKETGRYPLDKPAEVEIKTEKGTNLLIIAEGKATVTEADCPDKLCVSQKDIRYDGETIVCLPHRVVVSIEGGEEMEVDAVAN